MRFKTNIPIYLQVINDIKTEIVGERLDLGSKLPSTRELAIKYEINPNTAVRVYNEMEKEGLCFTKRGLGTFLTEDREVYSSIKSEMAGELIDEFIKGMTDLGYTQQDIFKKLQYNFQNKG